MCRYGFNPAKSHFVCFDCRKGFKKGRPLKADYSPKCPECAKPLAQFGLDFKVPARNDHAQWQKVRYLHSQDFIFHSCGCGGSGIKIETLKDAQEIIKNRGSYRLNDQQKYEQSLLRNPARRKRLEGREKAKKEMEENKLRQMAGYDPNLIGQIRVIDGEIRTTTFGNILS